LLLAVLIVNNTLYFNAWNANIPNKQALVAVRMFNVDNLILEGVSLEILRGDLANNLSINRL
jgi:hypothetical protein